MLTLLFTTLWQPCYNLVINLLLTLYQPCHKVVTRLWNEVKLWKITFQSHDIDKVSEKWFWEDVYIHLVLYINAWTQSHMYQLHLLLYSFNLVYITSHLSISIHCGVQFYLTRLWVYCTTFWQGCCKSCWVYTTLSQVWYNLVQCRQPCGNLDFSLWEGCRFLTVG